jgi:type II secretory pathway component PulF
MGSYNHDFVSFRRWFFSVISISYGKYGFLSTSHIIKTLSFPVVVVFVVFVVVVVVVVVVVCAFIKLNSQLRLRCACAATAMRERCEFHRSTIAIGNAFIDYTVFIPLSQRHRSRSWKLSFSGDVTKL